MATWYARNVSTAGNWAAANQTIPGGLQATAQGSLGSFTGSSSGVVIQPVIRYYTATVFNADASLAANGIRVFIINSITGVLDTDYPLGIYTSFHPTGHPTQTTADTGWVAFSKLALPDDHLPMVMMIPDQGTTVGFETAVSIPLNPQVTGNGNG